MATLRYTIQATHAANVGRSSLTPAQIDVTVAESPSTGRLTVTQAAAVAVPLGSVVTPRFLYAINRDADNYISILDDATEIGRLLAGESCMMALPSGVTLKAQADTDDCLMDFAVYGAA
jgi:copper(I)-binding protein